MKTLRVTLQFCLALCLLTLTASAASASTLTLTGNLHFPALDGSAQDSDGLANGTFTVNGDLVLDGTIHCNDVQPLPQSSGACPIKLSVSGDLTVEPGSGVFAENRRGEGNGGNIQLSIGGDLTLRGPEGSLPGAIISTSQLLGSGGFAGNLTAEVVGAVDLQAGSVLAANSKSARAGAISVTGDTVLVAGLIASGPSRTLLATPLSGEVLNDGSVGQAGGTIHLRALGSSEEAGLQIESGGIVVSQGEGNGGKLVLLEACGIQVRGLVASLSRNNGPSQVVLRSGKDILVDGRDLGSPLPAEGRFGRIRADGTQQGAAGYLVDLFANSDIQVLGPDPSLGQGLFAVTSRPGDQPLRNAGGTITAISLSGALIAIGNAFETGRDVQGDKGGVVDLQARGDVTLDGATIWAVGGFTSNLSLNARAGGHIDVRSFQGAVSWTFGVGDVRPTGTGVALARRGTIEITACSTVDITGTQFPVSGSAIAPFPVETEGTCSPTAPSLPDGEPALPVCAPANQPPAPTGGPFSVAENSPNGTVVGTVSANDPDAGQSHTFSIVPGEGSDAFAIDPSTGQITVADSTKLDFETKPSFTLTIEATDSGTPSQSGTGTVIVNLTDANDSPKPSGGPFTIPENSPNGTVVGTVSANDPDTGQTHTFSITGTAFAIDSTTGQITVADSTALNFEVTPSFSLTVQVTDSGSLTGSTTVLVNLTNVPEAPVAVDEGTPANPYVETVGNTLLEVTASPTLEGAKIVFNGNVLTNDFDPDGPATFTATLESATAGAVVTVHSGGTFTYVPPPGFTGVDSFIYRITGSDGQFDTARVYINVEHRVWYVSNDADADGLGRSTDPFDTLGEAESASSAGDTIYLFAGNDTTLGQSDGIVLKSGQRLIGEAVQLAAPATVNINGVDGLTLRSATGNKPKIENDNAPDAPGEDNGVSVPAITESVAGVEIRGLEISGFDNAIDVSTAGANSASVTIRDNVISGANFEGIDVTAASTGTITLAVHDNTLTATGTAIDIQRSAGTAYITAFDDNAVSGNTAGTGINISGAIFDALPGSSFDTVSGGVTVIGAPGNGVGQSGLVLTSVQGRLTFADLDVFANSGAGLRASSTTAYTGSTGLQLVVSNPGVAILEAEGGPVVDISQASITLPLSTIKSTNSPTTGLALNSVIGNFSAGAGSSISNITSTAGTAFQVGGSNAAISYAGTITTAQGKGVDLTSNTGSTIDFTGVLTLSTGPNAAFNAASGGTVISTEPTSTLTSTTGTALNVVNTTIGSGGLRFQSISANGAASGIVLNNTGSSGHLSVQGTGAADSGGTIQNTTSHGVSLTSTMTPSFTRMRIQNTAGSGIKGTQVAGFTFTNGTIDNSGTALGAGESNIAFNAATVGTESNVSGTVTITGNTLTNAYYHGVDVQNFSGTLADISVSNNTVTSSSSAASSNGSGIRLIANGSASTAAVITKATISNNIISNFPSGSGIRVQGGNGNAAGPSTTLGTPGNAASLIAITNNRVTGASAASKIGLEGILVTVSGKGQGNFDVSSNGTVANPIANVTGTAISINALGAATVTATASNNVISPNNTFAAAGIAAGVNSVFGITDAPDLTVTLTNNSISAVDGNGILAVARNSNGILRAKIQNNTVSAPLTGVRPGIRVDSGTASGNTTVCLNISGNTSAGSGGSQGVGLRKQGTVSSTNTFGVNGMAATDSPGVEAYIDSLNPAGGGTLLISATSGFSNCSLP